MTNTSEVLQMESLDFVTGKHSDLVHEPFNPAPTFHLPLVI